MIVLSSPPPSSPINIDPKYRESSLRSVYPQTGIESIFMRDRNNFQLYSPALLIVKILQGHKKGLSVRILQYLLDVSRQVSGPHD